MAPMEDGPSDYRIDQAASACEAVNLADPFAAQCEHGMVKLVEEVDLSDVETPDSHHARGDSRTLGPLCRALFSVQTYCSASALDRCDKRRSVTAFGHIIVQ
jgi:hypothetical protein